MRHSIWKTAMVVLAASVLVWDSRAFGQDEAVGRVQRSPELEVLGRFVGAWTTRTTSKSTAKRPEEVRVLGVADCKWILDGHFVRFQGKATATDEEDLQIMTYDSVDKVYRQWFYDAEGNFHHRTGTWDRETRTLLWKGESNGVRFVIDDRFLDDDTLVYTLTGRDKTGDIVLRIEGEVTRRE